MTSAAIATLNPDDLIERIANGAFLRDLAIETGIDKRRLSEQLRRHPEYAAAKEAAIECQLDAAEEKISLSSNEDIACAREQWRAATWRAERECAHRWGPKQEITVMRVDINAAIESARLRANKANEINDGLIAGSCVTIQETDVTP